VLPFTIKQTLEEE